MSEVPKHLQVWLIFFSSDSWFSPTISLSQGSGHFKWSGQSSHRGQQSSHRGQQGVQERGKKRRNLGNSFEPEVRVEVTKGQKSLLGHTASVQSVSHQTQNEDYHFEQSLFRASCSHQPFGKDQEHTQHDDDKKFCSLLRYVLKGLQQFGFI